MRVLIAALLGLMVGCLVGQVPPVAGGSNQPNIVMVLLDDVHGPSAERLFERSGRIDSLFVERGVRLTGYTGNDPLCCPGRANLLTGLYTHHHGVDRNVGSLLDDRVTIATELHDVGYWTAYSGKYLNGVRELPDKTPDGWDRVMIHGGGYYPPFWFRNGTQLTKKTGYSTDVAADWAVRFLEDAPAGSPVFLLYAPYAVHRDGSALLPMPAPRHVGDPRCDGIGRWDGPAYNETHVGDKPVYIRQSPLLDWPNGWPLRKACEAMLSVGEGLSDIVAELQAQGRYDDTLFVLTADNGMGWGDHRWPLKEAPYAAPLPLYLRWPARWGDTPANRGQLVSNVDLAPTFCALAGCQLEADGLDLMPVADSNEPIRDALLEEHRHGVRAPAWWGIRTTEWHYVEYATGERELYDLTADPSELSNRAGDTEYAATQAELAARLLLLRTDP